MNILSVLTYYRPHTSGLTIYAERLARAFAARFPFREVLATVFFTFAPSVVRGFAATVVPNK